MLCNSQSRKMAIKYEGAPIIWKSKTRIALIRVTFAGLFLSLSLFFSLTHSHSRSLSLANSLLLPLFHSLTHSLTLADWVKTRMALAVVRSNILLLKGSRTRYSWKQNGVDGFTAGAEGVLHED